MQSMARTHEVPKDEWEEFFKTFSRQHKEWLITITQNTSPSVQSQPLAEIRTGQGKLFLGAGDYFLVIEQLTSVSLITTDEGADKSIEIMSESGKTTIVIENPALPEMVDGIP